MLGVGLAVRLLVGVEVTVLVALAVAVGATSVDIVASGVGEAARVAVVVGVGETAGGVSSSTIVIDGVTEVTDTSVAALLSTAASSGAGARMRCQ